MERRGPRRGHITKWPVATDNQPKGMSKGISLTDEQRATMEALSDEYRVSFGAIARAAIRVGLPTVMRMLAADRRKGRLPGG